MAAQPRSRVSFTVDPSMFAGNPASPDEIFQYLDRMARPDLHYHYSGSLCAHRWLEVCGDPAYGHVDLLGRLASILPCLIRALRKDSGRMAGLSLVSLGPGDGSLDELILRSIDSETRLTSYCALDFSFELLRLAVRRIARADGFRSSFPIRAVCADFTELADTLPNGLPDDERRLFSLTGFTLGNYPEEELLRRIGVLMRSGDYLFLDARLHRLGSRSDGSGMSGLERAGILGSYDLPSVRRFVFGPVEVATLATVEEVTFGFDLVQRSASIPNAVHVLIYCKGLDSTLRLCGRRVERERLDLAVTTLYHYPDLLAFLDTMGFRAVWHQDVGGVALLLLRRREEMVGS